MAGKTHTVGFNTVGMRQSHGAVLWLCQRMEEGFLEEVMLILFSRTCLSYRMKD